MLGPRLAEARAAARGAEAAALFEANLRTQVATFTACPSLKYFISLFCDTLT